MIGQKVAHYRITAAIGAGGMGAVYRATDTRLGREVALKVLPPEMASNPEWLQRFEREARAVAALNHPHVVTIYSVDESEGMHFLTMELVEGESLNRLIPDGGMPVPQLLDIAAGLADGLTAAHEKGIVHRDLKPANAMVTTEGRVKVLDFGLAKISGSGESANADLSTEMKTREGVVMGTMPYMSPEQLQGRQLDHRTDIFSLGVMLYEMASGERPFRGDSSIDLASAILRDTPRPLAERRRELPDKLTRIITRCMEKSAADRFPSVREVRDALRAVSSGPSPSESPDVGRAEEGPWVAVLSFKHSGTNTDLAALAEGLRDDIATGLSRFSYLRVMSPDASADSGRAREGTARYVMEGNLRQAGTKLRVAVQLVDTTTGAHLWSETYERAFNPEASFELQDDLVPRIVSTCADRFGVLARSISDAARGGDPHQLSPYQALMRGFGYHQRLTPAAHAEAREALEHAVERAPSNAECWAMLSWIYSHEHAHVFNPRPGSLERALDAARRAVDIAPTSQLAQQALAVVLFFRKETAGCLSAAERAIALNPLDASNEAMFLIAFTGDWERGFGLVRLAMERNPHHPRWYGAALGINEYRLGNYRAVVDDVVKANAPEVFWSNLLLAAAHAQLGEVAAARNALQDLLAQKENFAEAPGEFLGKWFDPQLVAHLLEGLRKAGLGEKSAEAPAQESSKSAAPTSGAARAQEGFWVAVLPFKHSGANAELIALADGLTEDIVTGLSRFSYLRVIARSSTSSYANESVDVNSAGRHLGARYVMEGSLRHAGARLRLAVQLVDTNSGAHLWAENFERTFSPETVFELQDDLVPRIVSTVADMYGVLTRSMSDAIRDKADDELTPHEAVLSAFGYMERVTPDEHARVRRILERAVSIAPNQSNAWAMLANLYWEEHAHGLNPQPDPLGRALAAARRAVEAGPSNNLAHYALASTLFFHRDFLAFRQAAEQAIELNPMDASVAALIGNLIAYAGDWERGTAVVESAMKLNPRHPGWYWFAFFNDAYRQRDYRGALGFALKINLPGNFYTHAVTAAAYGQLGMSEEARKSLQELLAIRPDFAKAAREEFGRWNDPAFVEHILDGLRKAGLEIAPEEESAASAPDPARSSEAGSGAARAEEGFWIAVLPFKYSGGNSDLTALAEGLTEDIVTGLSRFSYLKVIARSSTARYTKESDDVRSAGKELGARYVMEGSLRHAGTKLRLAVQLIEATTGAHLWAENYERTFSPDALFELQDELVPRIVSTVADTNGILAQSMSEAVRSRDPEQLTPYEAVLRSFGYARRLTPEELAASRYALQVAVRKTPAHADALAMLAWLHVQDYAQGFNLEADSLASGLTAAQRAVDAEPSNHLAWFGLAQALFFHKEFQSFRNAADRAVALNPMGANTLAFLGELLGYAGDWERGLELATRAKQLNPTYPGWYWYADFYDAYRRSDFRAALGFALKVNLPGQWFSHAASAAAFGQLGETDAASKAVRELLKLRPDFAAVVRNVLEKWWEPEYIEHMIDGWRKAGLEIPPDEESAASASDLGHSSAADSGAARAEEGFWVAVLPFRYSGGNADLTALVEGLTEDIVTGLSRFSYLKVIARSSTARYANESVDVRSAGKELGARYVMEGSLRHAGTKLRLAVQLIEATTGAHLWAENYERTFNADALFELQDELVPRIVSTVADTNGILARSMSEAVRTRDPEQLTPYEAVLRSFGYGQRITAEELSAARFALELAVRKAPAYADAWAMLAWLHLQDYGQGFNLQADSLASGLAAAQRAVDLAPSNHLAWFGLAQALFFQKEFESFRNAAERAVALNPMDGNSIAGVGELLGYAGDWERGLELATRAKQLNPTYPGWYWYADFYDAYRRGDYQSALGFALKVNLPGQVFSHAATAAAYGQLGETDAASKAVRRLLELLPDFAAVARKVIERWWEPEYIERVIDGWRKAGLEIPPEEESAASASDLGHSSAAGSGVARAEEGFWVAVLPFRYSGGNADLTALAEGLTEDIVTGLSRFSYLRVIARSSTAHYANESVDVRTAGKELGARYVMEGALRHAGAKLRLAVQLVDATTGAHLWAENYERTLTPESVFELQDELVPRIVSTVADWYGILPHSMSEAVRSKPVDRLSPYEALLRAFGYFERVTPDEHAAARPILERAVEEAPGHAATWAMLSMLYGEEHRFGFNLLPDPLGRALRAARRAVEAAPGSHVCHLALAQAHYFRKEFEAFRNAAERAIALNPLDGATVEYLAHLLAFAGEWERGCELGEKARQLNPHHPAWYWALPLLDAFRRGDYDGSRALVPRAFMPGQYYSHALFAALYGQMGEREAAEEHVREALALQPDLAGIVRDQFAKWYLPQLVEQLLDGLRKAGLEIADEQSSATPRASSEAAPAQVAQPISGEVRSEEGFWVAVLPFKYGGNNADLTVLAEGLTEEIVTGLSRFSYLRVIAQGSTARFKNEAVDIRSAGKELGARYVMEGSLRQAGSALRVAVQLVDARHGSEFVGRDLGASLPPGRPLRASG